MLLASLVAASLQKYALDDCHEEFPFLFPFLQNLLTVTESNGTTATAVYAQQIFSEILKILSTLHHQLRMAPESIESVSVQALALMFMLKQVGAEKAFKFSYVTSLLLTLPPLSLVAVHHHRTHGGHQLLEGRDRHHLVLQGVASSLLQRRH